MLLKMVGYSWFKLTLPLLLGVDFDCLKCVVGIVERNKDDKELVDKFTSDIISAVLENVNDKDIEMKAELLQALLLRMDQR